MLRLQKCCHNLFFNISWTTVTPTRPLTLRHSDETVTFWIPKRRFFGIESNNEYRPLSKLGWNVILNDKLRGQQRPSKLRKKSAKYYRARELGILLNTQSLKERIVKMCSILFSTVVLDGFRCCLLVYQSRCTEYFCFPWKVEEGRIIFAAAYLWYQLETRSMSFSNWFHVSNTLVFPWAQLYYRFVPILFIWFCTISYLSFVHSCFFL